MDESGTTGGGTTTSSSTTSSTTTTTSYFETISNEILQASEDIVIRLEEGMNVLFGTGSSKENDPSSSDGFATRYNEEDEEDVSPLHNIADTVLGDIIKGQTRPTGMMDQFHAFRHAITWSEPFILCLVVFHVFMFGVSIWVTFPNRGMVPRLAVMLCIAGVVRGSEWINRYGDEHWSSFATQNYFDRQGFFMLTMVCGPLLLDSIIMLVLLLREAGQLLVAVKKEEFRRKRKAESAAAKKSSSSSSRSKTDKTKGD